LIPEAGLKLSRGCGNPTGFADLQPGEVVVDFGCGGGIDVILAAHQVGSLGRVIGIDFTDQMIDRARQTVQEAGLKESHVELHVADMEDLPFSDGFADVVISNCVINLCSDKEAVYRSAFRILRPGGRIAISDVLLEEDIAVDLRERFRSTWAGCLGGSVAERDYWSTVHQAGFREIDVVARHTLTPEELESMACCPGKDFTPAPDKQDLAMVHGKIVSVKFKAVRASERNNRPKIA
jgi:SAM-dependent methyltransferase